MPHSRFSLMRSRSFWMLAIAAAVGWTFFRSGPSSATATETDGEVAARNLALDLAGAFSNDGYKIRDGHWSGSLKPGEPQILAVNLYAGNQYYFSLGATDQAKKVSVTVFGEDGKPVTGQQIYQDKDRSVAAAGISAVASGPYYVSVEIVEGKPADFCLIYTYK